MLSSHSHFINCAIFLFISRAPRLPQQETTSGTAVTLIFMVIGICGYMCIPSISTWIVQTGGISSFNHTVARTTTLAAGLMGMAAGKGYAGGKAAWHGVRWVAGKLRGTRQ